MTTFSSTSSSGTVVALSTAGWCSLGEAGGVAASTAGSTSGVGSRIRTSPVTSADDVGTGSLLVVDLMDEGNKSSDDGTASLDVGTGETGVGASIIGASGTAGGSADEDDSGVGTGSIIASGTVGSSVIAVGTTGSVSVGITGVGAILVSLLLHAKESSLLISLTSASGSASPTAGGFDDLASAKLVTPPAVLDVGSTGTSVDDVPASRAALAAFSAATLSLCLAKICCIILGSEDSAFFDLVVFFFLEGVPGLDGSEEGGGDEEAC